MRALIVVSCAIFLLQARVAAGQTDQADTGSRQPAAQAPAQKPEAARSALGPRTRSNIKIDVTISDQTGNGPAERKVVSLIAAEESWGKIRTQAAARMGDGGYQNVALNVDARPFLTSTGAIQLELTVAYNPLGAVAKDTSQTRPTELNQSMTIVLQSGKPMLVSQAADPIMDRKIVVEVVAAILK